VQKANVQILGRYEGKVEQAEEKAIAEGKPLPVILPPLLKSAPPKTEQVGGVKVTTVKRKAWRIPGSDVREFSRASELTKAIPDEYFMLDEARIGKIVRAGGTIQGIEVYEEESLSVRA
jgi:hypothetical protein